MGLDRVGYNVAVHDGERLDRGGDHLAGPAQEDRRGRRGLIVFCERCPHYSKKTIFPRTCYNGPQCLVGIAIKLVRVMMIEVRTPAGERRKEGRC